MSSKINNWFIIKGHFKTFYSSDQKLNLCDIITLYGIPLLGIILYIGSPINFVLIDVVLVYTIILVGMLIALIYQEHMLIEGVSFYTLKREISLRLYDNIFYGLLWNMLITFIDIFNVLLVYEFQLIALYGISHIGLTILLIFKRIHTLLTIR